MNGRGMVDEEYDCTPEMGGLHEERFGWIEMERREMGE